MDPTTICILLGIGETLLFLLLTWFVRRGYRGVLAGLRNREQDPPRPQVTAPLSSTDDESERGDATLEKRAGRLGLACSKPMNAVTALSLDKELQPNFSYFKNNLQMLAHCSKCATGNLRMVYAGKADFFEGCLGCYCFTCGAGVASNPRLSKEVTPQESSDLFLLLKRWEGRRQALALVVSLPLAARNTRAVPVEPRDSSSQDVTESSAETPPTG